jgi:hypothetical protein
MPGGMGQRRTARNSVRLSQKRSRLQVVVMWMILVKYVFFFFSPFDTDDVLTDNKKIPVWYGNNAPKKDSVRSLRDTGRSKRFTTRDVVKHEFKDKIDEVIKKDPKYDGSHKTWLSLYPKAVTDVINGLTDDQEADIQEMAEEWNDRHPPIGVQAK